MRLSTSLFSFPLPLNLSTSGAKRFSQKRDGLNATAAAAPTGGGAARKNERPSDRPSLRPTFQFPVLCFRKVTRERDITRRLPKTKTILRQWRRRSRRRRRRHLNKCTSSSSSFALLLLRSLLREKERERECNSVQLDAEGCVLFCALCVCSITATRIGLLAPASWNAYRSFPCWLWRFFLLLIGVTGGSSRQE